MDRHFIGILKGVPAAEGFMLLKMRGDRLAETVGPTTEDVFREALATQGFPPAVVDLLVADARETPI